MFASSPDQMPLTESRAAETAAGDYPEETVATMARVCLGAESQKETHVSKHRLDSRFSSNAESIALSAMYIALALYLFTRTLQCENRP